MSLCFENRASLSWYYCDALIGELTFPLNIVAQSLVLKRLYKLKCNFRLRTAGALSWIRFQLHTPKTPQTLFGLPLGDLRYDLPPC